MLNVLPNQTVKLNYSIIRGTTPTFNLKIPATLDHSIIADACIVFAQQKPIFSLSLADCTFSGQVLSFTLTQQQTYLLRTEFPVLIQINLLATGGQVLASYIFSEEVKPNLCLNPFGASLVEPQPNPNVSDDQNTGLNSSDQRIGIDFGQIQNISGYAQAGEYDSQTLYTAGQVVTYNGSSYVAKQATVGNLPTDTTYWQLVASKGDDGYSPTITVKTDTPTAYVLTITDENGSYDTPNLKATIPNESVVSGITLTYDGDEVNFVESTINLLTGQTGTQEVNIALANSQNAGLMSPASVEAIQQLTSDVAVLKGQTVRLAYDVKTDPTAQEIQAFVISEGYTDQSEWVHIAVVVVDTNYVWRYYTDDGWMQQTDTVSQWTNSVAGIILGSELDGQIYAEDDGTGSVVGWNNLKTSISNLQTGKMDVPNNIQNNHIVFWDVTNSEFGDSGISYTDLALTSDIPTALSQLTEDSTHRLVTDTQIAAWNNKVDKNTENTYVLYGKTAVDTQTVIPYSNTRSANSIAQRGANGTLAVGEPTANEHATTKLYVDNGLSGKQDTLTFDNTPTSGSTNPVTSGGVYTALDGKVSKVTIGPVVYGTLSVQGTVIQTTIQYSDSPIQGLIYRDANGRSKINEPIEDKDIANKKYVDDNTPLLVDWTV